MKQGLATLLPHPCKYRRITGMCHHTQQLSIIFATGLVDQKMNNMQMCDIEFLYWKCMRKAE
jgi:hypothetical protein